MAPIEERPPPSRRTRVTRHPERASYERARADAVFDEALICHVGAVRDGEPVVLPMVHARAGDRLLLHGSTGAGLLRPSSRPSRLCATATLVDGVVFAASVFGHSINYRAAVVFGPARPVDDPDEKLAALQAVVDHLAPGRWGDARLPAGDELRQTAVVELVIEEWSVKARSGPPLDGEPDRDLDVWSGVVPLSIAPGAPAGRDPAMVAALPAYLSTWAPATRHLP